MAKAKKAQKKAVGMPAQQDPLQCIPQVNPDEFRAFPSEKQLKRNWRYPVITLGASITGALKPFDPDYDWTICIGDGVFDLNSVDNGTPNVTIVPDKNSSSDSELVVGIVTQNAVLGNRWIRLYGTHKTDGSTKIYLTKDSPISVVP